LFVLRKAILSDTLQKGKEVAIQLAEAAERGFKDSKTLFASLGEAP